MALGILKLIYILSIIIGVMIAAALIWKPSIFKKPQNFLIVQLFPVLISFIIMTSMPANYILGRVMGSLPILISIVAMIVQKKNYKWANYLTVINIIMSVLFLNII